MTKKERTAIKKTFGTNFPEKIAERLAEKKVKNSKGGFFSQNSVRALLDGRPHSFLEGHVREVWEEEVERKEAQSQKINKLIERSKSLV